MLVMIPSHGKCVVTSTTGYLTTQVVLRPAMVSLAAPLSRLTELTYLQLNCTRLC